MTILTVGAGQTYATIAAAVAASADGDVVQVQAGTYTNDFSIITKDITLEGVGGMVQLVATASPSNGKAILTTGADVTIRNFEFSGAAVADGNGAGIRYEAGHLVVENSYFHDNQNGLLANEAADGTITIRNTEFAFNGTGDGYTHNLYVGKIATLTVEDSYFHDAAIGHEIKSRAAETIITDSRIIDGEGTASYSIDLPNGGRATITGNVIEQGANSDNPAIIHFGGEGAAHAASSLTIADNTIVNDLDSAGARLLWNQTEVTAELSGNQIFGLTTAQIATGLAEVSGLVTLAARPVLDLTHTWLPGVTTGDSAAPGDTAGTGAGTATDGNAGAGEAGTTPVSNPETTDTAAGGDTAADGGAVATPDPVPDTTVTPTPVAGGATPQHGGGTWTPWTGDAESYWKFLFGTDAPWLQGMAPENAQASPVANGPGADHAPDATTDIAWHPVDVTPNDGAHQWSHHVDPWG